MFLAFFFVNFEQFLCFATISSVGIELNLQREGPSEHDGYYNLVDRGSGI